MICLLKAIFNELIVLANKLLVDKEQKFLVLIWTSALTCGTVVYCKGGADMAQMSLEELYRGEGAGEKYGILGELMKGFFKNRDTRYITMSKKQRIVDRFCSIFFGITKNKIRNRTNHSVT